MLGRDGIWLESGEKEGQLHVRGSSCTGEGPRIWGRGHQREGFPEEVVPTAFEKIFLSI